MPWEPSATVVVVFGVTVWLYVRGILRSPITAPWRRQLLFWFGLAVLYVCLHTHLDYYSEHAFFVNRLQQLGLQHLGPFLIILAYPGATIWRGLPVRWRLRLRAAMQRAPARWLFDSLLNPWVASLLFVGLMVFWLWPPVHFDAMLDWRLYRLMNWSMVVAGLLYWWLILDHRPRPPARLSPGMRILVEMAVMVPLILVGAYITFASTDLYPIYSLCGRAFADISPLLDQHLGGLIVWIPSSMMSVLAALIALGHWIRLDNNGRLPKRRARHAAWRARVVAQTQGPETLAGRTGKSV
ncbi:MAG TPA: cytochrome c oxidase assembly protein [Gammaproteobacteria bacterium]|nr:cytochrome c oxidase assembly protein [Gammaproteobacteria bacterium]